MFTKLLISTFLFSWGFLATKQSKFIDRSWCVVFLKFDLLEATLLVAENAFGIGTLLSFKSILRYSPSLCMLTPSLEASYINILQSNSFLLNPFFLFFYFLSNQTANKNRMKNRGGGSEYPKRSTAPVA